MTTSAKRQPNLPRTVRRSLALLLALVLAALCLAGCERNGEPETVPEDVVRIGLLEPFTGADAKGAEAELRGIKLAHILRPEVAGRTVELVRADNESSLKKTVSAAEAIVRKGAVAALGSYGNMLTLASSNTFRDAEIPLVNVTGTNPLLTGSSPYLFRTATVETDQAAAAAAYLRDVRGITSFAILLPAKDDYAESMAEAFEEAAGGNVDVVFYVSGTDDFTTQIDVLRSCVVEAVFLPGSAEDVAAFLKAAKKANVKWTYFGTEKLKTDEFLSAAGVAAEGLFTTGDWDPFIEYTDTSALFLRMYRLHYGEDAVPTEAEALGFEAYMLIAAAMERSHEMTGRAIRAALANTTDFEGVTGLATMDTDGDLSREVTVWKVAEGAFVNPLTYSPSQVLPTGLPGDED